MITVSKVRKTESLAVCLGDIHAASLAHANGGQLTLAFEAFPQSFPQCRPMWLIRLSMPDGTLQGCGGWGIAARLGSEPIAWAARADDPLAAAWLAA